MEKSMESVLNMGIEALYEHGSVAPVAFMMKGTKLTVSLLNFNEKKSPMQVLKKFCKENNIQELIIMTEGYLFNELGGIRLSKASVGQEAIIVQGEDINGNSSLILQPFHRDRKGKIILEKKIRYIDASPFGLMSGI